MRLGSQLFRKRFFVKAETPRAILRYLEARLGFGESVWVEQSGNSSLRCAISEAAFPKRESTRRRIARILGPHRRYKSAARGDICCHYQNESCDSLVPFAFFS